MSDGMFYTWDIFDVCLGYRSWTNIWKGEASKRNLEGDFKKVSSFTLNASQVKHEILLNEKTHFLFQKSIQRHSMPFFNRKVMPGSDKTATIAEFKCTAKQSESILSSLIFSLAKNISNRRFLGWICNISFLKSQESISPPRFIV